MELNVFENYEALSARAAGMIVECVKNKPSALLCFASGDSPKLTYQLVVELAKKNKVDFGKCFFIGLDEWLGISPDNTGSCHYFFKNYLIEPLALQASQVHLFDAMTANEEDECKKMNGLISSKGSIDFMLVGVGMNGHIGFNEPGTDINAKTHVANLDATTKTVGQKYFEKTVAISKGITVGLKQAMDARVLVMMANGKKKAPIIKLAVEGPVTGQVPASFIQQHSNGILMIDKEAAADLEKLLK